MEEFMFLGLRMTEGICEQEFQKQFGRLLPEIYGTILEKYENMGFFGAKGRVLAVYQSRHSRKQSNPCGFF